MSKREFQKALRQLMRESGLADDVSRMFLTSVSNMRGDIRRLLIESGLYNRNQVNALMRELDALMEAHLGSNLRSVGGQLNQAYINGVTQLDEMVLAFEAQYPLGLGLFDTTNMALALSNTFGKITLVDNEMRGLIRATVQQGVWMNLRPFEVMQQLTHITGIRDMRGFRQIGLTGITAKAERIARTEMMTAHSMGFWDKLQQAGEQFPDLEKVWMATGDLRTRDDHLEAHGQRVPYNDLFHVGGENCVGPHDPVLTPRQRVNCRCRSVPYRAEWGPVEELTGEIDEAVALERARRAGAQVPGTVAEQHEALRKSLSAWRSSPEAKAIRDAVRTNSDVLRLGRLNQKLFDIDKEMFRMKSQGKGIARLERQRAKTAAARDALHEKIYGGVPKLGGSDWAPAKPTTVQLKFTDQFAKVDDFADDITYWRQEADRVALNVKVEQEWIREIISADLVHDDVILWGLNPKASMSDYQQMSTRAIRLGLMSPSGTTVHEFGHYIEHMNPWVHQRAMEFLTMRADEFGYIMEGGLGYGSWRDKWYDQYMGRIYHKGGGQAWEIAGMLREGQWANTYATEVVSAGLEAMYRNPLKFLETDPEHFDFISGILSGALKP